jgi:small-conductance mechanosensitive channel
MEMIGNWLAAEFGLASWVVGLFVLPLLALLLIFGIRELILLGVSRLATGIGDKTHGAWRRLTRHVASLLSLFAIGLIFRSYGNEILGSLFPGGAAQLGTHTVNLLRVLVATVILVLMLLGMRHTFRTTDARIDAWRAKATGFRFQGVVLLDPDQAASVAQLGLTVVRFFVILFLLYLYVPLALSSFPATAPFAHRVMPFVMQPLGTIGMAIVHYIPSLITLILIVVVTRWTLHLLRIFMNAVGDGQIKLGSFNPVWAQSTYHLIYILTVLLAIVLVYPFLPGSGSPIFKGVSVFLAALMTFGGRSLVDSLVSGLILTYNCTFEVGDLVRIGDATGHVIELGGFVTVIRTSDNKRVSIPNSIVMDGEIVNISEAADLGGLQLEIDVGVGYETEWRQVYDLLKSAASKTDNIKSDPAPSVDQSSLDDYAVTYALTVTLEDLEKRGGTRSELLENIQDAFNEAGVEIMTPAVRAVRNSVDPAIPEKYVGDSDAPPRSRVNPDAGEV